MGRPLRMDGNGLCHHIMFRGHNDLYLFDNDSAKRKYLELLFKYTEKHDVKVFAYCIMDNHAHLMILSGKPLVKDNSSKIRMCISDFMHDVQTAFAKWYNKKFNHRGTVYNERFKSVSCYSKPYFLKALAYILANPINHGISNSLNYKYSSYRQLINKKGKCNIDALCNHLDLKLEDIINEVHLRVGMTQYPTIKRFIEQALTLSSLEQVAKLLDEFGYALQDLSGRMRIDYFKQLQKQLLHALKAIGIPVKDTAKWINLSKSYLYRLYKHTWS